MTIDLERLTEIRQNSQIRLDREGRWFHQGQPVENIRVQRLFHRGVTLEGERARLTVGTQWCYVQHLEDTAFFVEKVRIEPGRVVLQLMDETTEPLDPTTLRARGDEDVYCTLSGGRPARFLRDALAGLAPLVTERFGALGVELEGAFYEIARVGSE